MKLLLFIQIFFILTTRAEIALDSLDILPNDIWTHILDKHVTNTRDIRHLELALKLPHRPVVAPSKLANDDFEALFSTRQRGLSISQIRDAIDTNTLVVKGFMTLLFVKCAVHYNPRVRSVVSFDAIVFVSNFAWDVFFVKSLPWSQFKSFKTLDHVRSDILQQIPWKQMTLLQTLELKRSHSMDGNMLSWILAQTPNLARLRILDGKVVVRDALALSLSKLANLVELHVQFEARDSLVGTHIFRDRFIEALPVDNNLEVLTWSDEHDPPETQTNTHLDVSKFGNLRVFVGKYAVPEWLLINGIVILTWIPRNIVMVRPSETVSRISNMRNLERLFMYDPIFLNLDNLVMLLRGLATLPLLKVLGLFYGEGYEGGVTFEQIVKKYLPNFKCDSVKTDAGGLQIATFKSI